MDVRKHTRVMPDYGSALQFGLSVIPETAHIEAISELVQLANVTRIGPDFAEVIRRWEWTLGRLEGPCVRILPGKVLQGDRRATRDFSTSSFGPEPLPEMMVSVSQRSITA
jgi:hypothetical protein